MCYEDACFAERSQKRSQACSKQYRQGDDKQPAQTGRSRPKVALQCGSTEAAIRGAHQHGLFTTAGALHLADFLALAAALQATGRLSAGS